MTDTGDIEGEDYIWRTILTHSDNVEIRQKVMLKKILPSQIEDESNLVSDLIKVTRKYISEEEQEQVKNTIVDKASINFFDELQFVKDCMASKDRKYRKELAEKYSMTTNGLSQRLFYIKNKMKIKTIKKSVEKPVLKTHTQTHIIWTNQMTDFLKKNHGKLSALEISKKLGIGSKKVHDKIFYMRKIGKLK